MCGGGGGGGWESGSQRIRYTSVISCDRVSVFYISPVSQCCRGLTIAGALDLLTPDDIHDIESLVIIHNPFGNNLARALEGMTVLFLFPCQ